MGYNDVAMYLIDEIAELEALAPELSKETSEEIQQFQQRTGSYGIHD